MDRARNLDVGRLGAVLSCAALFFAVFAAALAAHFAIDLAGDYLLPSDAYDDVPHDSRAFAFAGAIGLAVAALGVTLRLAFWEARGNAGVLRTALSASLPLRPGRFVAAVAVLTPAAVAAMGALDAAAAGAPIDSLSDLFGGSLALGGSLSVASALALGALAAWCARLLARAHRSLVRAVCAFVRAERPRIADAAFARRATARDARLLSTLLARRAAGRAPPHLLAAR